MKAETKKTTTKDTTAAKGKWEQEAPQVNQKAEEMVHIELYVKDFCERLDFHLSRVHDMLGAVEEALREREDAILVGHARILDMNRDIIGDCLHLVELLSYGEAAE